MGLSDVCRCSETTKTTLKSAGNSTELLKMFFSFSKTRFKMVVVTKLFSECLFSEYGALIMVFDFGIFRGKAVNSVDGHYLDNYCRLGVLALFSFAQVYEEISFYFTETAHELLNDIESDHLATLV